MRQMTGSNATPHEVIHEWQALRSASDTDILMSDRKLCTSCTMEIMSQPAGGTLRTGYTSVYSARFLSWFVTAKRN
eukprot:scaffold350009_cov37-Prasinocladus_malaysianus.AAC.1